MTESPETMTNTDTDTDDDSDSDSDSERERDDKHAIKGGTEFVETLRDAEIEPEDGDQNQEDTDE